MRNIPASHCQRTLGSADRRRLTLGRWKFGAVEGSLAPRRGALNHQPECYTLYRAKLGLADGLDDAATSSVVDELFTLLKESHVDYTSFFQALGSAARGDAEPARGLLLDLMAFDAWAERWTFCGT